MISPFSIGRLGALTFGSGSFVTLPEQLSTLGEHTYAVIISATCSRNPSIQEQLKKIEHCHQYHISGEPSVASVDSCTQQVVADGCTAVIGIGGGSVLDTAKAVSVMAKYTYERGQQVSVQQFLEGVGDLSAPDSRLPLVMVPTTAGTGSEATNNAVISDVGPHGFKKSLRHVAYICDVVIIDPTLAVTVDHHQSAASGLDALTQLMEAYTSTRANLYIDSLALGAIGKLGLALPQLLNGHLDDITLREDMAYAAYISGLAIAHAGLGYVHGLAGPLGALHHAPHGVICGKLIGPINAAMLAQPESNTYHDKLRCIASLWNLKDPSAVISHIESIVDQAQFPSLKSYGYTLEELKHIGLSNPKRNSPISLEGKQLVAILEQLY